jgi:hypothetical protein
LRESHRICNKTLLNFQREGTNRSAIAAPSVRMMTLRDVGRFMLGMDPEDCSDPFG